MRNQLIESAGLDTFTMRFPRLLIRAHYYYRYTGAKRCVINRHAHMHWEVTRVLSGELAYRVDGRDQLIRPGPQDYLVIPPRIAHGWRLEKSPLILSSWQVSMAGEDKEGAEVLKRLAHMAEEGHFLFPSTEVQRCMEDVLWEMSGHIYPPQCFGPMLAGMAQVIIGDWLSHANPWETDDLQGRQVDSSAERLAKRMKAFLDDNLSHAVTLQELESHFHYSSRHLNRLFQDTYGMAIGVYLREQRLSIAKRWLEETRRTIKDISLSLGYGSSSQFCRYFQRQTGLSPGDYRRKHAGNVRRAVARSVKREG